MEIDSGIPSIWKFLSSARIEKGNPVSKKGSSVERVRKTLHDLGIQTQVQELPGSTRTASEAARAVGSTVGQIVKSLVFVTSSGLPLLILTSGSNHVNEDQVAAVVGEMISFADPATVREETGFAIGGVSPYGLKKELPIYIDQDLLQYERVWAAAGSSHAVFDIPPQILVDSTQGKVISVC